MVASVLIMHRGHGHAQTKDKILALYLAALAALMCMAVQMEWSHLDPPERNNLWEDAIVHIESMLVYSRHTSSFGSDTTSSQSSFSFGLDDLTHHRTTCAWVLGLLCRQVSSSASCPHMQNLMKSHLMQRDSFVWRLASFALKVQELA
jgi:hypothetical protein